MNFLELLSISTIRIGPVMSTAAASKQGPSSPITGDVKRLLRPKKGRWGAQEILVGPGDRFLPYSTVSSLLQKSLRQGKPISPLARRVVEAVASASQLQKQEQAKAKRWTKVDARHKSKLKSILTNLRNRLTVMAFEEGGVLMLNESERGKLVKAFKTAQQLSIDSPEWEHLAPVCDLLERCEGILCRIISHVWALGRLQQNWLGASVRDGVVETLRKVGVENPEGAMEVLGGADLSRFQEGDGGPLLQTTTPSFRAFEGIVPANREFAQRGMLHTGAQLVAAFPGFFGQWSFSAPKAKAVSMKSAPMESAVAPAEEEMRRMGVFDRHTRGVKGADRLKSYFALNGAKCTGTDAKILDSTLDFGGGARFSVRDLEKMYIAEKLLEEAGQKALSRKRAPGDLEQPKPKRHMPGASLPDGRERKGGLKQMGFKDWTLKVEPNDTVLLKNFGQKWYQEGASDGKCLFLKHHTSAEAVELQSLVEQLLPMGVIEMLGSFTVPKEKYEELQQALEATVEINAKHVNATLRSTRKRARDGTEHIFIVQPFLENMMKLSGVGRLAQASDTALGKGLLAIAILVHLVPLTDFNGTNVGFDAKRQRVLLYDLNLAGAEKEQLRLRTQRKKGFATAQKWNALLRGNMRRSVEAFETQALAQKIVAELRRKASEGRQPLAARCLAYAEKTQLGKNLMASPEVWKKLVTLLIDRMK